MKILKRSLTIAYITIIVATLLINNCYSTAAISINSSSRAVTRIALFSKDLNDDYLQYLRKGFEDIEKKSEGKVIFTFYNANSNESTQNSDIDAKLAEGVDLILLDPVNNADLGQVIKKVSQYNIPIVVFNREPLSMDVIRAYKKSLYVGTDSKQAGALQGKMLVDVWNNNKSCIDKNKDDILEYILLVGEKLNKASIDRSTSAISTIQQAGIKTKELAAPVLNWDTEIAKNTVDALFSRYNGKIEAIISNDDSMAIGALQALQKYGYNNGNKSKQIPIVGVDATPEAKDLISKGFMLGSPFQDPLDMVNAIYTIGMNLVNDKNPVEGTPYKLDETSTAVRIPFEEYVGQMCK